MSIISFLQAELNQRNEYYVWLRARAKEEGDLMSSRFAASRQAYAVGAKALAKELSTEGREHQQNMESFNMQASEWIFIENNINRPPGEIDLHGLYVKEALSRTDQAIEDAKRRGDTQIYLIVGKRLHSSGGAAKIKPAIEDLIRIHHLIVEADPRNHGVLIVHLGGQDQGWLDEDGGCLIM